MNGYLCQKPLTLFGVSYLPGDHIPAEAVLHADDLLEMGCIAPWEETDGWKTAATTQLALEERDGAPLLELGGGDA